MALMEKPRTEAEVLLAMMVVSGRRVVFMALATAWGAKMAQPAGFRMEETVELLQWSLWVWEMMTTSALGSVE